MPTAGELARCGFLDTAAAAQALAELPDASLALSALGEVADPDAAVALMARIAQRDPACSALTDPQKFAALARVVGASPALGEHILRHPVDASIPAEALEASTARGSWVEADVRASLRAAAATGQRAEAVAAIRGEYRRWLLAIASRDVAGAQDITATWTQLSDLADAALAAHLSLASRLLAIAEDSLAVIAFGKCGARELNYVSDVDVMFVAHSSPERGEHDAIAAATRLATTLIELCSEPSVEGPLWQVDPNLRPEGRRGALVRTLDSYVGYYARWAQPWEFQALLKARAVCGELDLGHRFVAATADFVWQAAADPGYLSQARQLRQRAEQEIDGDASRELKLGPGGLRDVEFSVQLLQLVHGREDETLRVAGTLGGLAALAAGGYVGREDAATLQETYRFLRSIEHRLQLRRLQRTHSLPEDERELRWLGLESGVHDRLEALGFADPDAALRHVQSLAQGVSRRAAIQRTLLPVVLSWLAESPMPDAGLLAFRRLSEELGETHWYLRTLRDESQTAERLVRVLGSSRWLTELLLRSPDFVAVLGDDVQLLAGPDVDAEMSAAVARHADVASAVTAIRSVRRRELLRIGCADLLGLLDVAQVGDSLTRVMSATVSATLDVVIAQWQATHEKPLPTSISVIGVGRFGGAELGYGSDADVLFVHEPAAGVEEPDAANAALEVIGSVRALLGAPSPEPVIDLDADLRPEGRNGPLVRTVASYDNYFAGWSAPWESQAMLRARVVAGDVNLGARLLSVFDRVRWPLAGFDDAQVREVRRIKARVESERLPRGVDPAMHLKLGPGGLSDVEWTAQLLQLRFAGQHPALRTTATCDALAAARDIGAIAASDEAALVAAWRMCTQLRDRIVLLSGRASDSFPREPLELAALAQTLGAASGEDLRDIHLRLRRRARAVMERVFYGR
ncbi:MAG: bifunctional [glutamine synthetase] adenylyltransferase/[glutamine synthetase]-adenylyl-L-tyrosine phosphorylase [Actinobacteria bacterium]|nr:bifunctional [glutamine synthetase] adenylyltransferase/[glutamine synthetase]-adenylyl-L-tyrosine phosphorylase [Actinomycetota bacterium]